MWHLRLWPFSHHNRFISYPRRLSQARKPQLLNTYLFHYRWYSYVGGLASGFQFSTLANNRRDCSVSLQTSVGFIPPVTTACKLLFTVVAGPSSSLSLLTGLFLIVWSLIKTSDGTVEKYSWEWDLSQFWLPPNKDGCWGEQRSCHCFILL